MTITSLFVSAMPYMHHLELYEIWGRVDTNDLRKDIENCVISLQIYHISSQFPLSYQKGLIQGQISGFCECNLTMKPLVVSHCQSL